MGTSLKSTVITVMDSINLSFLLVNFLPVVDPLLPLVVLILPSLLLLLFFFYHPFGYTTYLGH